MKTPFRGYTAILYKEFLVVLRDPITLFFMFFPPLIQMIMFGYALDTDVKNVALVVLDEDRTAESRLIVDRFVNTGTFKFVGEVASVAELAERLRQGTAYVGLQIPPGFTRELHGGRTARVQVVIDGSNSTIASAALNTSIGLTFRESVLALLAASGRREVPVEVRVGGPFVLDEARVRELQLTPRELEILGLIAEGLSNREIAERVFVSENTVKTHASRVFDKLGARRRTEAVQLGKSWRLIP